MAGFRSEAVRRGRGSDAGLRGFPHDSNKGQCRIGSTRQSFSSPNSSLALIGGGASFRLWRPHEVPAIFLKVCEGWGSLRFRAQESPEIYCPSCAQGWQPFPVATVKARCAPRPQKTLHRKSRLASARAWPFLSYFLQHSPVAEPARPTPQLRVVGGRSRAGERR